MDDAGIIALFNARDERSLEETAAAYGPWCRAIAMNLLGVREDAEECVSDALHALWRRIPPESPVSLRVYLGRIVRNIAVSRRREKDAQKRGGGQLELLMSELGECVPDGFDVEAEVERRALGESISRWLDTLPASDRAAFVRRYWYGEGVKELAKRLGCRPEQLSQRLFRARRKLKAHLESEGAI